MTKETVYSSEDTLQNINDRYLESVKQIVKEALEKIPEQDRIDALIKDDAMFRIFSDFEALYRIIFGSQIELLIELRKKNEYMPKYDIRKLFDEQMAKRKIEFDVNFDKWLSFLVTFGLIKEESNNSDMASLLSASGVYRITDKGVTFLSFMDSRDYDPKSVGL
jgi:hypothetical protein